MYRNHEGYADPTMGSAISRMMAEYRLRRRQCFHDKNRPRVYIASPYKGDVDANVAAAIRYCRFAIRRGKMPLASHLLYPRILDDDNPKERELGLTFGLVLLGFCDEVWVFGDPSPGMIGEIHEAENLGKPVRYFTTNMEEIVDGIPC
ncbi:MAG: hypothetical protein IJV40_06430 [Oscillospiraceae bacterium]|nr:hypothetical protein [Oscillospiraceae bacterium]